MATRRADRFPDKADEFWADLARRAGYHPARAARLLGLSLRQFERVCQRDLDQTPRDYLQAQRMRIAAGLIAGGVDIKVAALEAGYFHLSNFSRDFKRLQGVAPSAFAKLSAGG